MKMTKREYLSALLKQDPEWVRASMARPSPHMRLVHVLLHGVALRRMARRARVEFVARPA